MFLLPDFIDAFPEKIAGKNAGSPWLICLELSERINVLIAEAGADYIIKDDVAIHHTTVVEQGAVIKGPAIIGAHCFIAAHAYLRGGVYLGSHVVIGPGCEVKSSLILNNSHLAHFNFVGDSLVGTHVNFEAGAIVCNHWNERVDKHITLNYKGEILETGLTKFGAIVGDNCKIGANAVLSPGTLLAKNTVVKRLELVEQ